MGNATPGDQKRGESSDAGGWLPGLGPRMNPAHEKAPVRVGTSGYSFKDWVGPFYPPGTRASEQLGYYAQHFSCLEVNVSFYRVPDTRLLSGMCRRTPQGFDFIVKLHGEITHRRNEDPDLYRAFRDAVEPLRDTGKMAGFLAQFPYGFKNGPQTRTFLRDLRDRLPEDPLFVEFRHESWTQEPVFPFLRELDMGYVSVDEPRMTGLVPPLAHATTDVGYVRLHGRNAGNWYARRAAGRDRYDYLYSDQELEEWATKIRRLVQETRLTYVFFNNCHAGQAPVNAQAMKDLLGQLAW